MTDKNPLLSVIIPTFNNPILYSHLKLYAAQTAKSDAFEIIVVNDGGVAIDEDLLPSGVDIKVFYQENAGPAKARNYGASKARGERLLFVGDDCLPSQNLVLAHILHHLDYPNVALQGYSPFHPDLMDTKFMHWLELRGLQANWGALKSETGWKTEATGFLLTTNWSINKADFVLHGGFPEGFPDAAWEDVALGHRLMKLSYKTRFSPAATNYHWHKHTIGSFLNRQKKEGRSRIFLCSLFPEISGSLLNPNDIRGALSLKLDEMYKRAETAEYLAEADADEVLQRLMVAASYHGVMDKINEEGGVLLALPHVYHQEFPAYIVSAWKSITSGDQNNGYLGHLATWATQAEPGNWAAWAFAGEIELATGNYAEAYSHFKRSVEMSPANEWPISQVVFLEQRINER